MIIYALSFYIRVLFDLGALIRMQSTNQTNDLSLSASKLIFSLPMIGSRPLIPLLMPCEDYDSFESLGFCPDRLIIQDSPYSPFQLFVCISVLEILIGILFVYKIRALYIEEFVPIGQL